MEVNKLKILGVCDEEPFHHQTWSGISRYFFESLRNQNYLYKAISAAPTKATTDLYKLLSFHPDIRKWKFKYHINIGYYGRRTQTALKKIKSYNHEDYNLVLQIGAWYDLTKLKNKLTVSYHDGNFATLLRSPYGYPQVRRSIVERTLRYEKELYAKLDLIFTMSRWLADSFVRDFNVPSGKVMPVGAGVNLPYIRPVEQKTYEEPNILFVGKNWERKGGRYLLEAFQRVRREIKNATLTVIGPSINPLPEGVRCTGFVSKSTKQGIETLLDEYCRASIFVLPTLYEPFGVVFAEAMAHKLPCIGSDICAIPEIIDDGVNGYVVPVRDSQTLADRIIGLLKEPRSCREFGQNAFRKYCENYTWDIVVNKMVARIRQELD